MRHIQVEMYKLHTSTTKVLKKENIPRIRIVNLPEDTRIVFEKPLKNLTKFVTKLSTLDKTYFWGFSNS